ncbi:MAG: hypothetical protein V3V19_05685 [Cocleimonas sp.]
MKKLHLRQVLKSFFLITVLATMTYTKAEDTEVFSTVNITNNLLFVLDVSGSMNSKVVTTTYDDGTTATTGGVLSEYNYSVNDSADDAQQDWVAEEQQAEAGDQNHNGNHLEFQPDNIVATRFSFDNNSILRKGRYSSFDSYYYYYDQRKGWKVVEITDINIGHSYIKLTAAGDDSDTTAIKVSIEDSAAQVAHDIYDFNNHYYSNYKDYYYYPYFPKIESRNYSAAINWQSIGWTTNGGYTTPNVSSLIQQVVNRWDWDEGIWDNRSWSTHNFISSLAFKFKTESGKRVAFSFDGSSTKAPELNVTGIKYKIKYSYCTKWRRNGSCKRTKIIVKTVLANELVYWNDDANSWTRPPNSFSAKTQNIYDDAEQEWVAASSGTSYTESSLVFDDDQVSAVRFDLSSNAIPQGSFINNAYIQFSAASDSNTESKINIQVENSGAPVDYATDPDIKGRAYESSTQIGWTLPASMPWTNDGTADTNEKTPDLVRMVQHVVDKSDWGNVIAFRLFGELGDRIAHAQDSGNPPVLHVEFQDISGVVTGGSGVTTTRTEKRIVLLKEALREVMESAPNVNVGLMKYSGFRDSYGSYDENKRNHFVGGVLFPVSPIYENAGDYIGDSNSTDNLPNPDASQKVRAFIPDVVDEWEPTGGTPIVDALYEAALYYRGENMHYGKNKNNNHLVQNVSPGSHPATYEGGVRISKNVNASGRTSIADRKYISPITSECQSSFIVLMSDGGPTYYYPNRGGRSVEGPFAQSRSDSGIPFNSTLSNEISSCLTGNGELGNSATKFPAGTCGREITQYLATVDQIPQTGGGQNKKGLKDDQFVKTFTVGFGQGLSDGAEDYLRSLATADGQGYYTADNKTELKSAFENIFDTVAKASGSLASPGYSVNVNNGLEHEDDIYIPVFDRKSTSRWSGNLKKFKLVDVDGKRRIQGKNDKDAVNEFGGFTEDALDYWSKHNQADGLEIEKGGVAELINPDGRTVLTDVDCSSINCELVTADNDNSLISANTNITNALLGIDTTRLSDAAKTTLRRRLIDFARGWEGGFYDANATPKGEKRHFMGDMLHSEPVVITYAKEDSEGAGKKQYIFAGTNEGYLHAFNTADGLEEFAFMPQALLKNIKSLFDNRGTYRDHKYGVDGSMTYWHDDTNKNDEVDTGETVYLYFGLRRGGRAYYAMDISDIKKPKLLWKKDSTDTGMSLLGESWSTPYLAKVGLENGTTKEVMIVSGGYDKRDDRDKAGGRLEVNDSTTDVTAIMGNNVFIIDAKNGNLLWSLQESMGDTASLQHSIPGGMRILDVNHNGLIDRMYFADTGGDVWRLDLSEKLKKTGDDKSVLTKFASLGGADEDRRKFYNEPDVATLNSNGKTVFAISIGSGFRAHPNDKNINDNMYVLQETSPFKPLASDYSAIIHGDGNSDDKPDLAIITIANSEGELTVSTSGFGDSERGWYLDLPDSGEKVLATAVVFDGVLSFTTLVPAVVTQGVDACNAPTSSGRLYAVDILTGEAGLNLDESEPTDENKDGITDNDIFIKVVEGEITGTPQRVFNAMKKTEAEGGADTCEHPIDLRVGKKLTQATGYDACRLESVYWNDPQTN